MYKINFFSLIFIFVFHFGVNAQLRKDKLYTISGIGTAIPIGETTDYFGPKISTSLGLNYGIGNSGLFIYPKVSLHAFTFNGIKPNAGFSHTAQQARASSYLLNVAIGYRKMLDKVAFYGFAGGGGGLILTPNVKVNATNSEVAFSNHTNKMFILEGGAGLEYSLGDLSLFTEVGVMNGFNKIQEKRFTTLPLTFGIKPNLSKLFKQ